MWNITDSSPLPSKQCMTQGTNIQWFCDHLPGGSVWLDGLVLNGLATVNTTLSCVAFRHSTASLCITFDKLTLFTWNITKSYQGNTATNTNTSQCFTFEKKTVTNLTPGYNKLVLAFKFVVLFYLSGGATNPFCQYARQHAVFCSFYKQWIKQLQLFLQRIIK